MGLCAHDCEFKLPFQVISCFGVERLEGLFTMSDRSVKRILMMNRARGEV
jgi:hypothetical protein